MHVSEPNKCSLHSPEVKPRRKVYIGSRLRGTRLLRTPGHNEHILCKTDITNFHVATSVKKLVEFVTL